MVKSKGLTGLVLKGLITVQLLVRLFVVRYA